jgi:ribosomal protein L37E
MTKGTANGPRDKNCPPHEPSGWECAVAHFDASGKLLPACQQCRKCGRQIRPDAMDKPVEVVMCDRCGMNEYRIWRNPEYYPHSGGHWCNECFEAWQKVKAQS